MLSCRVAPDCPHSDRGLSGRLPAARGRAVALPSQLQILARVASGGTDKQIARELALSPRTVEMHVARLLAALGCRSRAEAVRRGGELGPIRT